MFVVRTWRESSADARSMRGSVDHVASGTRRYFANFGDLCDILTNAQTPVSGLAPADVLDVPDADPAAG